MIKSSYAHVREVLHPPLSVVSRCFFSCFTHHSTCDHHRVSIWYSTRSPENVAICSIIFFSGIGKVHTLWDTSSRTRTVWSHQIWQYKYHSLKLRHRWRWGWYHPSVLCHHSVPSWNGKISCGQHLFVDWPRPGRYIASIHLKVFRVLGSLKYKI